MVQIQLSTAASKLYSMQLHLALFSNISAAMNILYCRSQSNGDSEDIPDEDDEDEDSEDSDSTDVESRGKKKSERRLDINPPDQKLSQAERKARKYSKKKQVGYALISC